MRFIILSILLLVSGILSAQSLQFENYTSEQGLSQYICTSIAQDDNGFMWIGTGDGLNRYDGREFKLFSQKNEAGKKLPSNYITSLYFDKPRNILWVGAYGGVCVYDVDGDSLAALSKFLPFAASLEKLSIGKIISTKPNEYWILSYNGGIVYMNTKLEKLQSFFSSGAGKFKITDMTEHNGKIIISSLYSIYELQSHGDSFKPVLLHKDYKFPQINALGSYNDKLWVGTISNGCYYVEEPIHEKENIKATDLVFGGISSFYVDNLNTLWIVTRGSGIHRYDGVTGKITRIARNPFDPTSPVSNFGLSAFKDRQGIMWFGLAGGISKYDPLSHQFNHIKGAPSLKGSLADDAVYCMYLSKNDTRFIGTRGHGIFKWDSSFRSYPATAVVDVANNVIYDITEDNKGVLWSATCGGLMELDSKSGRVTYYPEQNAQLQLNKMYALIKVKKADSLLVSSDDGMRFFSLRNKKWAGEEELKDTASVTAWLRKLPVARYIYEDSENTLWICFWSGGFVKYRYQHGDLNWLHSVSDIAGAVYHLLADGKNFLLATSNGILVYNPEQDKVIKHIDIMEHGSTSSVCNAVEQDENGDFWISTNAGIFKMNRQYEIVQHYNNGSGLSFGEFHAASVMKDSTGSLYFGGINGIISFKPSQIKKSDFSPVPLITNITVNDKPWPVLQNTKPGKNLKLDHRQNFLSIRFAVNNFSNEKNNQFSYRLKGLNDKWSTPATSNLATFTSLPPGDYVFELRSANSDGKWSNEITTLAIVIRPPWWQTWWFLSGSILLLAGLIIYLVRKRIMVIQKDATLKQQFAELEIKGLHAQMNPHFIFNSLNSIKEMILADEKQSASRYLSKFAQLIRTNLEQSRQAFITLKQCIDHLEQYLEMEKIRFEDFQYRIQVDEGLVPEDIPMAPMLIQPLVENAIWHGLRHKAGNKKLLIRFYKKASQLLCEINDNGTGIIQSRQNKQALHPIHRSLGITNVHERLAVLNEKYGMKCSLSIVDKSELQEIKESGTLATLQLTILN